MKKTSRLAIFPLTKGLDKTSVPGTQDKAALKVAKNCIIRNKPSLKKRPGLRKIPYAADEGGVQGAIHWFATSGTAQRDEIIRVRNGKVEALRDETGTRHFVDLGATDISPTDRVTFERFNNVLIIHFENSPPLYYTMGGSLVAMPIFASHVTSPPTFSRVHDFRWWYGGRRADPHRLWVSAPGNPFDLTLYGGGFSMRVRDGDGDPVGLTGLSPPFRGQLFAYKWASIYRIYNSGYGYGIDQVTDEAGAVHHQAICGSQNDVYSVDVGAIRSLQMTDKAGAAEPYTLSFPIYEWFQDEVNWSATSQIMLIYDTTTNTLLMSYASSGSSVPNRVLGMNTLSGQFFTWEDVEYPVIGRYFEYGRKRTFVADETKGMCVLDEEENTLDGDPINLDLEFGSTFPTGNPKDRVSFTKGWLLAKPTVKSVEVNVSYSLDGSQEVTRTVNTQAGYYGTVIEETLIGEDVIGQIDSEITICPFECTGEAGSIAFHVTQTPPELDPDQPCEIYGIIAEFDYDEDSEVKVSV